MSSHDPYGQPGPTGTAQNKYGNTDLNLCMGFAIPLQPARTSWGRRSSCYSTSMDRRCARAPQVPPQCPRFPPFPSRTSPTCLTSLQCAMSVRNGGLGPQASIELSHALWLGRVVRVPSARVRPESARILSLVAAHCASGCLCSCVWRRGTVVVDAGACLGVCGGLGTARRPPDRVHGPR